MVQFSHHINCSSYT